MPGKKGNTSKFTKELHVRRMGEQPLPSTLQEALRSNPEFRAAFKAMLSERAKRAEKKDAALAIRQKGIQTLKDRAESVS